MNELLIELMKKYNKLVERYEKAENYMDCYNLKGAELYKAIVEREKHIPDLKKLVDEMDSIAKEIQAQGYIMSDGEKVEGFRQIKYIEI